MLDRTVELSEVIEALKKDGPTQTKPIEPSSPSAPPPIRPSSPAGKKLEPTLDNVRSIWSQVVQDARAKTPLLGSLLAETEIVAVEGRIVTLRPGHAVHAEGLERQRDTIAQALGQYISEAPRVAIAAGIGGGTGGSGGRPGGGGAGPERITPATASAERLKSLRAKDPTLNAAVDALDLELLE
jgi:hypothetical protein